MTRRPVPGSRRRCSGSGKRDHPPFCERRVTGNGEEEGGAQAAGETRRWGFTESGDGANVGRDAKTSYTIDRGVAVIPITGVLQRHASMVTDISGLTGTSYEAVRKAIRAARRDLEASAILLHIDSPCGVVEGVEDLSSEIFEARQRKPIFALADGMMARAAAHVHWSLAAWSLDHRLRVVWAGDRVTAAQFVVRLAGAILRRAARAEKATA